ncbi:TPA: transposase [Streptococcus equi subsp. zooepidemicus]|nr:transposase [Streptococcus equi subsp. zooepidemicus]HEL0605049.1 transposase [Streptococcus equi subsp. zooepidemicus]
MKKKAPQRREALNGDFSDYHYFLWEWSVGIYVCYQKQMGSLEERITACLSHYDCQVETLDFIPSSDIITASIFISEVSVDMSRFPSTSHLASWIEL